MPVSALPQPSYEDGLRSAHKHLRERGGHDRVVGELAAGEDEQAIVRILRQAPTLIASGELVPLLHADVARTGEQSSRDERPRTQKIRTIQDHTAKRYVVRVATAAGPRVIKLAEPIGAGNRLAGLFTSIARQEHQRHARAASMGVAAAATRGFLELRRGPWLLRACQVQTPVDAQLQPFEPFLREEHARFGVAAYEPLARALAADHGLAFFHADVKGFHAFVTQLRRHSADQPAEYRLVWIDLGRVSFYMTPRKRIINLYQAFRFILPDDAHAQERFVSAYCQAAAWRAAQSERVLNTVRRFLRRKLRTHPLP